MDYLTRKCLGWYCEYKNKCKLHHIDVKDKTQFIMPRNTGEHCDFFIPQPVKWGEGPLRKA
jgi:hypothetical protein